MKRLLILANSDSAIFKFRRELIDRLAEEYHIGLGIPFGKYMKELSNEKHEFFNIPVNRHGLNPIEDLGLLLRYKKLIKSFNPDVVLTYTIKPNLYGSMACHLYGVPCLCNVTGLGSALEHKGLLQKMLIEMYRFSMKKVHTIFFQNSYGKEFFKTHHIGNERQYCMVPGSGVNLERFKLLPYPDASSPFCFLFVARIIREKGIEEFLYTARRFKEDRKNAEFHICGECEEAYQGILKKAVESGNVVYHGLVKDMRPMYKDASCIVLPSYYPEGLSNVLLEGAASGRPLITTDHPGCREAIDDEVTGLLVKKQDQEDLYEKCCTMYFLAIGKRNNMGIKGREKMVRQFDRQIVIDSYLERLTNKVSIKVS